MPRSSPPAPDYSPEEAKRRFEAALRGSAKVGHKPMKDIPHKRKKTRVLVPDDAKGSKGKR